MWLVVAEQLLLTGSSSIVRCRLRLLICRGRPQCCPSVCADLIILLGDSDVHTGHKLDAGEGGREAANKMEDGG